MAIKYKYNAGDNISGESITGWAGSVFDNKGYVKRNGVILQKIEFFKSAACIKDLPITSQKTTANQEIIIDGLRGHKIYGQSKSHTNILHVTRTGGHTHRQTTLKGNVYCVINIPIQSCR